MNGSNKKGIITLLSKAAIVPLIIYFLFENIWLSLFFFVVAVFVLIFSSKIKNGTNKEAIRSNTKSIAFLIVGLLLVALIIFLVTSEEKPPLNEDNVLLCSYSPVDNTYTNLESLKANTTDGYFGLQDKNGVEIMSAEYLGGEWSYDFKKPADGRVIMLALKKKTSPGSASFVVDGNAKVIYWLNENKESTAHPSFSNEIFCLGYQEVKVSLAGEELIWSKGSGNSGTTSSNTGLSTKGRSYYWYFFIVPTDDVICVSDVSF